MLQWHSMPLVLYFAIQRSDHPFCPHCREGARITRIEDDRIINNIITEASICPRPLCENLVVDIHRHLDDCLRTSPLTQNECMFFLLNFSADQLTALCDGNRVFLNERQTFLSHFILEHFIFIEHFLLNDLWIIYLLSLEICKYVELTVISLLLEIILTSSPSSGPTLTVTDSELML